VLQEISRAKCNWYPERVGVPAVISLGIFWELEACLMESEETPVDLGALADLDAGEWHYVEPISHPSAGAQRASRQRDWNDCPLMARKSWNCGVGGISAINIMRIQWALCP
jgi:hypothetical protein